MHCCIVAMAQVYKSLILYKWLCFSLLFFTYSPSLPSFLPFFLHLFLCLSFLPSLFSETEAQSAAEELMHRAIALCPPTTPTGISPNLRITCTGLSRLPTVSCQFCSSQYKVNLLKVYNCMLFSYACKTSHK